MKKIISFLIIFMTCQFLFAQTFTVKELISLYKISVKEVGTQVLKKGYLPIKLSADVANDYYIFRKPELTDRQLSIIFIREKPVTKKRLEFDTDHGSDWVDFKKEMEESEFAFNERLSNGQQRLWYDNNDISVILFQVQYESGGDDTYKLVVTVRAKK